MATNITSKKPAMKETVGAQYCCFNTMSTDGAWTPTFEPEVEKTETVKSVKVTENTESVPTYASGKMYDQAAETASVDIEVEVVAFPETTVSKMKGDVVDEGGLVLSGGNGIRPFFAYGKVVHLRGGKMRFDWYPKCKLTEKSDDAETKEDKPSEMTDTIKITAYPFNDHGDIVAKVNEDKFPEGLTEELFFNQVIIDAAGLKAIVPGVVKK